MPGISMRYIVDDVDAAVDFYRQHLGFSVAFRPAPTFAILTRDGFRLLVSGMTGPGGAPQAMPDGRKPEPGGWNRIQIEVEDLEAEVRRLRQVGARFRNEIVQGMGGKQILLEDPAGNPIELFEAPKKSTR
ncbi:VOC family protein [Rhizobium lentis]|uniref:VOC family protein n=1 Tax=Rhizobium lentis TaxID=1138194 RepID=UPI001C8404F2|nr:VOC family protein [Rhizobium lentis]MBX5039721.1 VOC family protein [Rhizobium lentis]MBX5052670.1 VOC family protein [Rhizobium lentis]MBX5069346.1 VOC family protein [Rhizobium lentis]MBX5107609.1 VOC family protein [Rhizobium lentis]MBX5113456.1 VOC family protein [Rhizobium lentis]